MVLSGDLGLMIAGGRRRRAETGAAAWLFWAGVGHGWRSEARKCERAPEGARFDILERAMRFELTTLTLARLCSTPELRPHSMSGYLPKDRAGRKGPFAEFFAPHRIFFDASSSACLGA